MIAFVQNQMIPAVVIIVVGFYVSTIVKRLLRRTPRDPQEAGVFTFMASSLSMAIKVLSVIMALSALGVDITIIVGSVSAVGVGISLAMKDNMANVAAGVQILLTKPFLIGNYIEFDGNVGTVNRIEIMFTMIRTDDQKDVIVPNSSLVNSVVINYSKEDVRRLCVHLTVPLNIQFDEIKEDLEELLVQQTDIFEDGRMVRIDEILTNDYVIGLYGYTSLDTYFTTRSALYEAIQKKRSQENWVESYAGYNIHVYEETAKEDAKEQETE